MGEAKKKEAEAYHKAKLAHERRFVWLKVMSFFFWPLIITFQGLKKTYKENKWVHEMIEL